MEGLEQEVVNNLVDVNPRFRLLYEEHLLFEKQLQNMDSRVYLTPEENLERKKIQKMKLVGKDEMHRIAEQFN